MVVATILKVIGLYLPHMTTITCLNTIIYVFHTYYLYSLRTPKCVQQCMEKLKYGRFNTGQVCKAFLFPKIMPFSHKYFSHTFSSNWNRFKRFHSLCLCNEEWKIKSFYINELIFHSLLHKQRLWNLLKRFQFDEKV